MKPVLLVTIPMPDVHVPLLGETFDVLYAPDIASHAAVTSRLNEVEYVLTNGTRGYSAQELAETPKLKQLSALGAGYENLAMAEAKQRGIIVSNGAGTNDSIVADHALALMLATLRPARRRMAERTVVPTRFVGQARRHSGIGPDRREDCAPGSGL